MRPRAAQNGRGGGNLATRVVVGSLVVAGSFVVVGCAGADTDGAVNGGDEATSSDAAFVPPRDADILLAPLGRGPDGLPTVGTPTNVTQRPGYDNQPHFTPDGAGIWYTAVDTHDGQADIWRYDPGTRSVARVTVSNPESEYSATPLPDGTGISTIRVEADSTQRLWRFDPDGANPAVILPDVAPVGYHAWADAETLIMFVLGNPPTLRRGNVRTGAVEILAHDVGRSIQRIPGTSEVSWVQRHGPERSTIMRVGVTGAATPIIDAVDGGDFHAWTPDGTLIMASGPVVYALIAGATEWTAIADFSDLHVSLSRLAVSPDGSQIAMVAELAPLEVLGSD